MNSGAGRVRAFDWLRGLAVLVMVQTHALSLLLPSLRSGPFFDELRRVDGLVAPSFILAAGFSLSLVQVRGAAAGTRWPRAKKSLRRIGEVLAVCTFMTWIWFPIFTEPKWLLRIDILNCIGLTLLVALPLFAGLATRPRLLLGVSLGLALAILLSTPAAATVRALPLARFLGLSTGSVFPLFPWSAYIFLGGSLGALAAIAPPARIAAGLLVLAGVGLALWLGCGQLAAAQPEAGWGVCVNHAERIMMVSGIALLLLGLEHRVHGRWQKSPPVRFVEVFGTSSLAAYFGHETMLFWPLVFGFSFHAVWGDRVGWPAYWGLTALLIAYTFVFTWAVAWVYERVQPHSAGPKSRGPRLAREEPSK